MAVANRLPGILVSGLVALGAGLGVAYLLTPAEVLAGYGIPTLGGGEASPPGPGGLTWMAWTPETGAFFLAILTALATMTFLELCFPGGAPRRGALGLDTTRGDRLFISLLGSAWILLLWLAFVGTPLTGGVGVVLAWWVFVFWRV